MSTIIEVLLFLLVAHFLVPTCLATGSQYRVPGVSKNTTTLKPSKTCDKKTFDAGSSGNILVEDCEAILREWQDTYFTIALYQWMNATTSEPEFTLITQGTCEIGIKRLNGYNVAFYDTLIIGDTDIKDLINESIELAKVGDGTKLSTVAGTMNCTGPYMSHRLNGTINWTLRKAGKSTRLL